MPTETPLVKPPTEAKKEAKETLEELRDVLFAQHLGSGRFSPAAKEYVKSVVRYGIFKRENRSDEIELRHAMQLGLNWMAEAGRLTAGNHAGLKYGKGKDGAVNLTEACDKLKNCTSTPPIEVGFAIQDADKFHKVHSTCRIFRLKPWPDSPLALYIDDIKPIA